MQLAHAVRAAGFDLLADNGTKPLIDDVLAEFDERATPVRAAYQAVRRSLPDGRRAPTRNEIPPALRAEARALAAAVLARVDSLREREPAAAVTARQLELRPTGLIAREDFAIACLLGLGLDRTVLDWPVARFTARNATSIEGGRVASALAGLERVATYATLAADDYHAARAAGCAAGRAGVRNVAVGFAGLNMDTTFTDVTFLPVRRRLPSAAPRRIVRLTEILLGLRDGYAAAGTPLERFHALGLGSRAQFPILAAAFGDEVALSADATSPLHDAVQDRVLYDAADNGARVTVRRAAERVLAGEDWPIDGPFLRAARGALGHDLVGARQWAAERNGAAPSWADLMPPAPLASLLPVYASGPGSVTSEQTAYWIGHNHWATDQATAALPSAGRREWGLARLREDLRSPVATTRLGAGAALAVLDFHALRERAIMVERRD